jgi:hypothetical protein
MKLVKFGVDIKMEDDIDPAIAVDWIAKLSNPPTGVSVHFIALDSIKTINPLEPKACAKEGI